MRRLLIATCTTKKENEKENVFRKKYGKRYIDRNV